MMINHELSQKLNKEYQHKLKHCYENAFQLFKDNMVEQLHVGYINYKGTNGKDCWIRHAWGLKDGEIIDSTILDNEDCTYYSIFKITNSQEMIDVMLKTSSMGMLEIGLDKEWEFLVNNIAPQKILNVLIINKHQLLMPRAVEYWNSTIIKAN